MNIPLRCMTLSIVLVILTSCTATPDMGNDAESGEGIENKINKVYNDSEPTALYNCFIIDGTGAEPISHGIILIKDGQIIEVISGCESLIPHEYRRIDIEGRTVLPGFINAHVHNAHQEDQLQKWASAGVTTVRDLNPRLGNFIQTTADLNNNTHNARVVSSTPIITVNRGYGSVYVNSPLEAREITYGYIQAGVNIIKFSLEDKLAGQSYSMLSREKVREITNTAKEHNARTSVHVSHIWNLPLAMEAGVTDLAHMVVEPLEEEMIQQVVKLGIYWVPTLELWRGVSNRHGINWDQVAIENLRMFYEAGGKIALGTDFGGYSTPFDDGFPITEVGMMKQAGMSNMDIIIAGTKNAAYTCHMEKVLGTIEPGKIADLLIVDGNPLKDINELARTYKVIKDGVIIYSKQ